MSLTFTSKRPNTSHLVKKHSSLELNSRRISKTRLLRNQWPYQGSRILGRSSSTKTTCSLQPRLAAFVCLRSFCRLRCQLEERIAIQINLNVWNHHIQPFKSTLQVCPNPSSSPMALPSLKHLDPSTTHFSPTLNLITFRCGTLQIPAH